jgi:hypothetical protein
MGFSVEGVFGIGAFGYTGFSVLKPMSQAGSEKVGSIPDLVTIIIFFTVNKSGAT